MFMFIYIYIYVYIYILYKNSKREFFNLIHNGKNIAFLFLIYNAIILKEIMFCISFSYLIKNTHKIRLHAYASHIS